MSPTRFVILSPARSGSTVFREVLDRHSGLSCHGELFGKNRILGRASAYGDDTGFQSWTAEQRNAEIAGFLNAYSERTADRPTGFKLLYSQIDAEYTSVPGRRLPMPFDGERLLGALAEQGYGVIHLWRRNLVKRLNSELRMRIGRGVPETIFDEFERIECLRDFYQQRQSAKRLMQAFKKAGCPLILDIDYEDLIADPDAIARVYNALGVGDDGTRFPPKESGVGAGASPRSDAPKGEINKLLTERELAIFSDISWRD